jgi:hypothetical protein
LLAEDSRGRDDVVEEKLCAFDALPVEVEETLIPPNSSHKLDIILFLVVENGGLAPVSFAFLIASQSSFDASKLSAATSDSVRNFFSSFFGNSINELRKCKPLSQSD